MLVNYYKILIHFPLIFIKNLILVTQVFKETRMQN